MNKRWLTLFLVIALFPGCTPPITETAPSEVLQETKPTESVGFSDVLTLLDAEGAIQTYRLDVRDAAGIRFLGTDILLFSGQMGTTLTLISGGDLEIRANRTLPQAISPDGFGVSAGSKGATYTDEATGELVFLDELLQEHRRIPLPEQANTGVLSADQKLLYYAAADAIRVLDLENGIDRLIRDVCLPCQKLTGLHLGGTVLECSAVYGDGDPYTLFLCAETGRLLYETREHVPLWTWNDRYFAIHMDGPYRELLSGAANREPMVLVAETEFLDITPVMELQSVLLHSQEPGGTTVLDCYHLETGIHAARLTLPETYRITDIQPDPRGGVLWLLCRDLTDSQDILCRWDLTQSDPEDPENYLQPRYSSEDPDLEGLAVCRALANRIAEEHDVRILLWTDATEQFSRSTVPEYQVPLIRRQLMALHEALSCYPSGFFAALADRTDSGRLNICLVRSIGPGENESASADIQACPCWDDNGDIWLAVTAEYDLAGQLHRQLFPIIDSRVLGLCDAYDGWESLNPPDFEYGSGEADVDLLTGENRRFTNLAAMDSAHLDRAGIMEYAMMENQAELFSSEFMQAKLRQLCLGIREAFRLTRFPSALPWEQYLDIPLIPET